MIKAFLQNLKERIFGKIDYKASYNAISEASYLESTINQQCHRPKYTKLKKFFTSLVIYLLFMSLALNIMIIRENAELKEHIAYIADALIQLNEEQAQIESQRQDKPKQKHKAK